MVMSGRQADPSRIAQRCIKQSQTSICGTVEDNGIAQVVFWFWLEEFCQQNRVSIRTEHRRLQIVFLFFAQNAQSQVCDVLCMNSEHAETDHILWLSISAYTNIQI